MARTEERWTAFVEHGPGAMAQTADSWADHTDSFVLREDETLAGVLARYEEVARAHRRPVPACPAWTWRTRCPRRRGSSPGATRSARRVFVHLVAETAQHAGHADILRETLDGQKSMG